MSVRSVRPLILVAAFISGLPLAAPAQQPSFEQLRSLAQARPELFEQLRSRISGSGLTPDQIRARLRAEGYPESLLDAYLPGAALGSTGEPPAVTGDVYAAVRELGLLVDSTGAELRVPEFERDSFADSADPFAARDLAATARARRLAAAIDYTVFDTAAYHRTLPDTLVPSEELRDRVGNPLLVVDTAAARRYRRPPPRDSGYTIFGLDVFRRRTTQFDANLGGPVDPSYRLGPGDRLVLILTGDVELSRALEVTREGFIVAPQVGQIHVANLSLAEVEDLLYERLGRVYSGVRRGPGATTRFSLSVARLRTNQVFVLGDVATPGSYRVSSAATALSALYAAGGPTLNGTLRHIEVRRRGRLVDTLDAYDYLLRGDASRDVRLETGDVVFVGVRRGRVRVSGEVIRPATYEIAAGETLADVIAMAGGYSSTASSRRLHVERVVPTVERAGPDRTRIVVEVTHDRGAGRVGADIPVQPGDVVHVFPIADRVRNRVVVRGHVWSPGVQGYTRGMRLSDAVRTAGGIKPDAYLGRVLISRLLPDSTRVQLRAQFRDTTGALVEDLALREDDEIEVFSSTQFRPQRYVSIYGAVRNSGRYPYRDGMTMRDLALMAGGLLESAHLQEAEVARLPEARADGKLAHTIRVPLDSSYVFDRGADGRYLGPPGLPAPAGPSPDVPLRPYDNVLILRQPNWGLHSTVVVAGEVRFPGRYTLQSKTERLSDVIRRAGGLTPEAYAGGVTFYRATNRLGRVGLDLPRVLDDPRARDNLIMQDGDSVFVPRFSPIVNVQGAVNSPVAVAYVPGADLEYYIQAAGGPAQKADVERAYVTQANGQVDGRRRRMFFPDHVPTPTPGSTVFVPERVAGESVNYVAIAGTVAQIVGSLVAIVAILAQNND